MSRVTKRWIRKWAASLAVVCWLTCVPAIGQDAVFKNIAAGGASRLTGQITAVTPEGLTIDGKQVPAQDIRRISVGKQPAAIARLSEHLDSGRYGDCLSGIDKLKNLPNAPLLLQEIAFMRAYATAQLSLSQGIISAKEAGELVAKFLAEHPDSFHTYPMVEQYGLLIYSFGRPPAAAKEFAKLKQADWPEMRFRGFLWHGRMMQLENQLDQARSDYEAILKDASTDPGTSQYQLLASCEIAKLDGLQGQTGPAIEKLRQMIKSQTTENPQLFACIYNAMGAVYENAGQLKAARTAYLHNPLLFRGEAEPTAEALYRLTKLWPQLNIPARANETREDLKSSFRQSYWAGIVDKN